MERHLRAYSGEYHKYLNDAAEVLLAALAICAGPGDVREPGRPKTLQEGRTPVGR
jgi:hypothetical protein